MRLSFGRHAALKGGRGEPGSLVAQGAEAGRGATAGAPHSFHFIRSQPSGAVQVVRRGLTVLLRKLGVEAPDEARLWGSCGSDAAAGWQCQ